MATSTASQKQPVIDARTFIDAVEEGQAEKVKRLLSAGADVNAAKDHGMTALMCAASKGHLDIVRILLDRGANVNATRGDGFTALIMAAFHGHFDIVRVLLDQGASVNAATRSGTTAQGWASSRGFPEIARLLKDAQEKRLIAPRVADEPLPAQSPSAKLDDASSKVEVRAQDPPPARLTILTGPAETPQFGSLSAKHTEADIRRMKVSRLPGSEPRSYRLSSLLIEGERWRIAAFTLVVMLASGMITYLITRRVTRPAVVPRNAPLAKDSGAQPVPPVGPMQPPAPQPSEQNEETGPANKVTLSSPVEAPATGSQTAAAPRGKTKYSASTSPPFATISTQRDEVPREDKSPPPPRVTPRQRPSPPQPEVLSSTEKEIQPRKKVTPPPVVQPQETESYEAPSLIVDSPKRSQASPKKKVINWP